jgi:acyl-coenzyme A thioesterase PaaI-like protein
MSSGAATEGTRPDERPRQTGPPGRPWSGGGREELAASVRRLMELTVTSAPPPGVLAETAAMVDAAADLLEFAVPDDSEPVPRFNGYDVAPEERTGLTDSMPFDMVAGQCNPLAPPIEIWFDPPLARGRAVFSPTYEGAPGWVHGAALAAAFDIILTAANVLADAAGPTVELTIHYRRPTLIGVESLFESQVTEVTDRRTHSRGVLMQNGKVTVEAVGQFVNIDRDKIAALHRMRTRHDEAAD